MPEIDPPVIDEMPVDPVIIQWRRGRQARRQKAVERAVAYAVKIHVWNRYDPSFIRRPGR